MGASQAWEREGGTLLRLEVQQQWQRERAARVSFKRQKTFPRQLRMLLRKNLEVFPCSAPETSWGLRDI